jgi:hypothetical protein
MNATGVALQMAASHTARLVKAKILAAIKGQHHAAQRRAVVAFGAKIDLTVLHLLFVPILRGAGLALRVKVLPWQSLRFTPSFRQAPDQRASLRG